MNILRKSFLLSVLAFTLVGCALRNDNLEFYGGVYENTIPSIFSSPQDFVSIYNTSGFELTHVELKVTLIGAKGDEATRKYLFKKWENNECKKVFFGSNDTVCDIQKAKLRVRSDQGRFDGSLYKN